MDCEVNIGWITSGRPQTVPPPSYQPVEEFRFREGKAPAELYFSVFAAQRELRPPFFNGLFGMPNALQGDNAVSE